MIVVTISSHTVSCSQGGSAHLGVGVIAITTLCTTASSIAQELVAHRRMSKGTCMTLFTILTVTSHNTKDVNSYNRYIQARNTASHAIRNARRRFESSLAHECKSNNKAVWNYVNSQKKSGGKNLQLRKGDGSFTKDDASTAEVLNQKYYDTFTKENMEELPSINSKPQLISRLSLFKVTREQVLQVLKDLRIDKSPGVDGIHPHILKELYDSISYPLSLIFQDCIKSGIIPQQWKDAIIAPIFKKGDRSLAKNIDLYH